MATIKPSACRAVFLVYKVACSTRDKLGFFSEPKTGMQVKQ